MSRSSSPPPSRSSSTASPELLCPFNLTSPVGVFEGITHVYLFAGFFEIIHSLAIACALSPTVRLLAISVVHPNELLACGLLGGRVPLEKTHVEWYKPDG
jgi:hypothetical protein